MTRYPSMFCAEVKAEERTQLLLKTVQLNGPLGVRKMIDWHEEISKGFSDNSLGHTIFSIQNDYL